MNNISDVVKAFLDSPCAECSMLSSLHAHTAEDAKSFRFGCEDERRDECRRAHIERLNGPPGEQGVSGEGEWFTKP